MPVKEPGRCKMCGATGSWPHGYNYPGLFQGDLYGTRERRLSEELAAQPSGASRHTDGLRLLLLGELACDHYRKVPETRASKEFRLLAPATARELILCNKTGE